MTLLNFKPVTLLDGDKIKPFLKKYGEGSCQHSFVSMVSLFDKYGDSFCIYAGFLFILRSGLCSDSERVYLSPFGEGDLGRAFELLFEDAAYYNKKIRFHTLTESAKCFLVQNFPGKFFFTPRRDYFEYIYSADKMRSFSSSELRKKRWEAKTIRRKYGDRLTSEEITEEIIPEILEFEEKWVLKSLETHDENAILSEKKMIYFQLEHFKELGITGIAARIDGKIQGFAYGTDLGGGYYDTIIEKGDIEEKNIYRYLIQEAARKNMTSFLFVNREEDVGVEGLRRAKTAYCPEILLQKFDAVERVNNDENEF